MDQLIIAGKPYSSRLLVGTGKYQDFAQTSDDEVRDLLRRAAEALRAA